MWSRFVRFFNYCKLYSTGCSSSSQQIPNQKLVLKSFIKQKKCKERKKKSLDILELHNCIFLCIRLLQFALFFILPACKIACLPACFMSTHLTWAPNVFATKTHFFPPHSFLFLDSTCTMLTHPGELR